MFLTKVHFLQFQKWPKIIFWTRKKFKTAWNAISRKTFLIYLISRVFSPGLFKIFWPTVISKGTSKCLLSLSLINCLRSSFWWPECPPSPIRFESDVINCYVGFDSLYYLPICRNMKVVLILAQKDIFLAC